MRELSLFTGAGGGLLGTHLLGWEPVGYVEWNEYCQRVIAARIADGFLPVAPIFTDVREFVQSGAAREYRGFADVVSAGFPCQPFSVAGKQAGADDERNMWPATRDVIRDVQPRSVLLENVPGLISCGYLGTVIGDLAALGYVGRWGVIGAADCGAPHKRDRLWIVAHANDSTKRAEQEQQQDQRTNVFGRGSEARLSHMADTEESGRAAGRTGSRSQAYRDVRNMRTTDRSDDMAHAERCGGEQQSGFDVQRRRAQQAEQTGLGGVGEMADAARELPHGRGTVTEQAGCAESSNGCEAMADAIGIGQSGSWERGYSSGCATDSQGQASDAVHDGWWEIDPADDPESGVGRVAPRMAYGMDRLKAIGNGQCSPVVARAWECLA